MRIMVYTIDMLMDLIHKGDKQYDYALISAAYQMADAAHAGQLRKSGDPYITHPVAVAYILVEMGMDTETICAALLHDVVEDTNIKLEQIQKQFGAGVALLVDGVTKINKLTLPTKEAEQTENVRKMLMAMSKDIRVIIIKLADRLHNMRTLKFRKPSKQLEISLETMEIYAPIAHRLGIRAVKEELEDISLFYLDPIAYHEIDDILDQHKGDRINYIEYIKMQIKARLADYHIEPYVEGRVKSHYGIYRKVYMAGRSFDEVFDIFAVRIIVNSVVECYNILGIIHDIFTPIPNRFKDYISMPKANMYQSLHTTVIAKEGVPFEVQIRTWDMHYTAEYGIAAHWKYKLGISGKDKLEERLAWIRKIIEEQQDDSANLISNIKNDIGAEEVFLLTPKGDVKTLPVGSTTVDFAYAIHSAVGNHMIGAKVDGRIVPIDTVVQTGQIVEIITSNTPGRGPSRDWLKFVKTSEARNKIRAWFKKERRDENIVEGKAELEREFKRNSIYLPEDQMQEFLLGIAKRQNYDVLDDFYAAIGYGGVSLSKIIPRIKDDYFKLIKRDADKIPELTTTQSFGKTDSGVIVENIENCLVKFAQCCNPLPGDSIIGFITRGHGVSVHKRDCVNVIASMKDPSQIDRWINVHWAQTDQTNYRAVLNLLSIARQGIVADVTVLLANMKVPVYEISAKELKNGNTEIIMTISVGGTAQLNTIIQRLQKIEGMISVERTGK
ncbi:MAG TPA: bifunctional (p)ppGpp synthetase/guanosine-3',5'-bis(diphosphate) 3'-pyrophosphohydrolase [Firmicutes bacterium]|nr:bifunctional (p)ppGpp synthetase/guanosine-3',5'-bis(diphosphate) 3'-pyrophosphohydrolase [Bacillota bacterium]